MHSRILITLIIFLFCISPGYTVAQDSPIDSLEALLPEIEDDNILADTHIELAKSYYGKSLSRTMEHAKEAYKISSSAGYRKGIADAENWMGNVYSELADYNKAMDLYLSSLKIREEIKDINGISGSYNNLAILYLDYDNPEKAVEYLFRALELSRETNDDPGISINLNNLMVVYIEMGKLDTALEYGEQCLVLCHKSNDKAGIADVSNNMGDIALKKGEYDKAEQYQRKALKLYRESNNYTSIAIALTGLAEVFFIKEDYLMAEKELYMALESAEIAKSSLVIADIHELFSRIYEKTGKYEQAVQHFVVYESIQDSIFLEHKANDMLEKQAVLDSEYRNSEIDLLEKEKTLAGIEISKQKLLVFFILGLSVISLVIIIFSSIVVQERVRDTALIESRNTDLYFSNKQIERSQNELMILNKSKEKFFSVISKDLLDPFNSFIALSKILFKNADSLSREDSDNYSARIYYSARDLYNLMQNLLHWSRSQIGRIQNKPVYLSLKKEFEESLKQFDAEIKDKGLEIKIAKGEADRIHADPDMLQTVLRNLLSNAVRFSSEGDKIKISSMEQGPRVEVSVEDMGPGMENTELKNLFSLDRNSSKKGSKGEKGTGLGLILCKELVEKMGGRIQAKSKKGKGTSISFTAPSIPMNIGQKK